VLEIADQLGPGFGQAHCRLLTLRQQLGLPSEKLRLLCQLDEDRDLGPDELGYHRLDQVIDRADGIAPYGVVLTAVRSSEKKDGCVTRLVALPDEERGFEAVHLRHLDVQKDDCEIVCQKPLEGFPPGLRLDEILSQPLKHGLQRHQVRGLIVHQEDVDAIVEGRRSGGAGKRRSILRFAKSLRIRGRLPRFPASPLPRYRYSHTLSSDSS
jgi:hypothetical protein